MCRGFSPTSEIRTDMQMKSGHLIWSKYRQASEGIDLQGIFDHYWGSNEREFIIPSQYSWSTPVQSYLNEKCRGRSRWKASLHFRITILCMCYCMFRRSCSSIPSNNLCIVGTSTLIAQRTRNVARNILPNDGRTDGEVCGQGYQIWYCFCRSEFSHVGTIQLLTPLS